MHFESLVKLVEKFPLFRSQPDGCYGYWSVWNDGINYSVRMHLLDGRQVMFDESPGEQAPFKIHDGGLAYTGACPCTAAVFPLTLYQEVRLR